MFFVPHVHLRFAMGQGSMSQVNACAFAFVCKQKMTIALALCRHQRHFRSAKLPRRITTSEVYAASRRIQRAAARPDTTTYQMRPLASRARNFRRDSQAPRRGRVSPPAGAALGRSRWGRRVRGAGGRRGGGGRTWRGTGRGRR